MTVTHSGASELSQLMEGTTAVALIHEIVRRGFQDLLEAEVSAAIGATRHKGCPSGRSAHHNSYRQRLHTTQVGDLSVAIPKLRQDSFLPDWLEQRRRLDKARFLYVYLDATYLHGRLGQNMPVVSRPVMVAIGINALGYREVLGIAVGSCSGIWPSGSRVATTANADIQRTVASARSTTSYSYPYTHPCEPLTAVHEIGGNPDRRPRSRGGEERHN